MNKDNILEQRNKILKSNNNVHTHIYKLQPTNCGYVEISMNIRDIPRPVLKRNNYYFPEKTSTHATNHTTYSKNICDILFDYDRK